MRRCFRRCLALLAALIFACLSAAGAEETLLPPSARLLQASMLTSGDVLDKLPEVSFEYLKTDVASAMLDAAAAYDAKETDLLINNAPSFYFYEHLDPLTREIYDLVIQISRDPVPQNIQVMRTTVDPDSDRFYDAYFRAVYAVGYDHPELFWIFPDSGETFITFVGDHQLVNGRYTVLFFVKEAYTAFETRMTEFNEAAAAFLRDIDRTAPDAEIVRQIHDKVMALTTYDHAACDKNDYDLAHTAYGVLVADTDGLANYAVCDGYSMAMTYFLQQCGIPASVVSGFGGSSPDRMGGHAWTIVQLDGEWYEVDCTWDDNVTDVAELEALRGRSDYEIWVDLFNNPDYFEKHGHRLFLISSDLMEHYVAPDDVDWSFRLSDGRVIDFPPDEDYHVRKSEGLTDPFETSNPKASLMFLLPRGSRNYQ
ncbi:MAG: hypothetical protein IJH78_00120 [Clostridia bacterium]|nr:hypothetical protein [Clostridia bacterium]